MKKKILSITVLGILAIGLSLPAAAEKKDMPGLPSPDKEKIE